MFAFGWMIVDACISDNAAKRTVRDVAVGRCNWTSWYR